MKSFGLLAAVLSLALGPAVDADAKGGRSHSSAHPSSHPAENHASPPPGHASDTHTSEGSGGFIREAIARPRRTDRSSTSGSEETRAASQAQLAAIAKANTEAETAAQEMRRQHAEQAAIASAGQQKLHEAAAASRKHEDAVRERQQRQLAWEARCQIQPVMTDLEISTCREAWTSPAP